MMEFARWTDIFQFCCKLLSDVKENFSSLKKKSVFKVIIFTRELLEKMFIEHNNNTHDMFCLFVKISCLAKNK